MTSTQHNSDEPGLTRRRLVQGAAWSVPVLAAATAAPLAAASVCTPIAGRLSWQSHYTRTNANAGSGTVTVPGGTNVPFTVAAAFAPGVSASASSLTVAGTTGDGPGLSVTTTVVTPAGTNLNPSTNHTYTITVSFQDPVENVRFRVWDVDTHAPGEPNTVREWVRVPTAGAVPTLGANLETVTGGWIGATSIRNAPNDDVNNAINYTIAGTVSTFQVIMSRPAQFAGGNGGVIIGDIFFDQPC